MVKTTENRPSNDSGASWLFGAQRRLVKGRRAALVDALMRPARIEIAAVLVEHKLQMALVQDEDVIEAFAADRADRALAMLEIDRDGFDQWDKRIIETLIHKFNGGPVGLNSLAVAVGEEAGTLEEVNEPYLIMEGYIKRTPQGRVATTNAYKKLGLKPPPGMQGELL